MTYAFVLDASACSGCKACQAACKDKNQLPLGVLWRRVYEVAGGAWKQEGAAWSNTVFAYNISISCNHCQHPKCAGVCPVDAYMVREDGIVLLDSSKCIGCGYCAWACPYGAPQYDQTAGRMTKCNFCYDNLEMGLPPACVSACPLRALDYAEINDRHNLAAERVALWETPAADHPYPMPGNSRLEPHLAVKPHAAMKSTADKFIANLEEVHPQRETGRREAPLVAFTLLLQMAVGGFWTMLWLSPDANPSALWWIGLCLGAGMLASFAHLGTKRNAWRVLNHLRKSWLSREILFTILFGVGWLVTFISMIFHANTSIFDWLTAWMGLGLIYSMSRVYHLPSIPAWDSWRTNVHFFLSAALLGILGMVCTSAWMHPSAAQWAQTGLITIALLITQTVIIKSQSPSFGRKACRSGLIMAGMIGCVILFFGPASFRIYLSLAVFLIILMEEGLGRWLFYQARTQSNFQGTI
ncbi:MAG TPA: DMSO/selenate family reductase complex B subunit [Anaerolineales bacterium]|nr:DMSO/selenate family reductase complex B subunit [Anaerolineales bacterium]